ncbi:MAG: hypothetical protein CM15mV7_0090 [uncultured marine virus]|nr:MAG: hypothetical protein CM15mV7_0090 [uncultured marine virus]
MIFLDKDWEIDDTPQYFPNAIEEVYDWCSWKDVEQCINNPQFYELEFIKNGEKLNLPVSPVSGHNHISIRKIVINYSKMNVV